MENQLIPHLFRTEYRKITSVLCKQFGIEHIEIAEDIASDVFLLAVEVWTYKGVPENPTAWLYAVARNKAKNQLIRNTVFSEKVTKELLHQTDRSVSRFEIDLSDKNISDSQLLMLFTLCHPSIPVESQISLSLRVLCGFGIEEIADAFLTNKASINKRLFRAKERLRTENIPIIFPDEKEIDKRLETVLTTLYLLFNEGYYSESRNEILRNDFCLEAIRLTYLLHENDKTNKPPVNALLALMCFHASRFGARKNNQGELILYDDQDETLWNQELIARGTYLLNLAAQGEIISKYHIEASIAYWHTIKADSKEKWENILQLYNQLLILDYSPIAALNRTYALSKVKGKLAAIAGAEKLNLKNNHFYFTLLGALYEDIDHEKAKMNLQRALSLAKSETDKEIIRQKILKSDHVLK
ncbi:RNA polymerase sigma factor [Dyadobacter subterraneus]|uniref:RNA polymerase subunit sigma n=1 Tax=Dyadobacter subterraneus TaxID=2773304 RepID=A0ABR9WCZ6_9BACT|nr:DUF6596 domain-containing protein [Dyadobacter subterraneus]MBE9463340.1 RNA polymerase subunit sigma [Dyadobacter subterraneus]